MDRAFPDVLWVEEAVARNLQAVIEERRVFKLCECDDEERFTELVLIIWVFALPCALHQRLILIHVAGEMSQTRVGYATQDSGLRQ